MIMYWALYFINPALLFKNQELLKDSFFQLLMFYLHAGNHLVLYLERLVFKSYLYHVGKPRNIIVASFTVFYIFIIYFYYFKTGKYVYPFMKLPIYYLVPIYISAVGFMLLLDKIYSSIFFGLPLKNETQIEM